MNNARNANTLTFGVWLSQTRRTLDLTQRALADQVGCSVRTIEKIEQGERRPSRFVAELLAQSLEIPEVDRSAFLHFARFGQPKGVSTSTHGSAAAPWSADYTTEERRAGFMRRASDRISDPSPGGVRMGRRHTDTVAYPPSSDPSRGEHIGYRLDGSLPLLPGPLIGREEEKQSLVHLLCDDDVRIVTLHGPAGIGKSRLALHVAHALVDAGCVQAAYFVPLASTHEPGGLVSALAEAAEVREVEGKTLLDSIKLHLRDRKCLLLLDNFEQILPAAVEVAELATTSPGLKILVTSREVLRLSMEHQFSVPPLATPDPYLARNIDADHLGDYDAARLFVQKARSTWSRFVVTDESAPIIAQICWQLEGLPLALELAAGRVRLFPPEAILQRLTDSLGLLTGGARDLPERQQTMRAALDWSYRLLSDPEKRLLCYLSVFAGDFTLHDAEGLCSYLPGMLPENDLHGLERGLAALVDKSLLYEVGHSEGDPLFHMSATVRAYAGERLEADGQLAAVRDAHAVYYLSLAE